MSGSTVTIGVFDGVHRGHRSLIARAREVADESGTRLLAVTFDPHPLAVVGPRRAPTSLATLAHRRELLLDAGADDVDVLAFDEATSLIEPEDFVRDLLVERWQAAAVVVGADFRFGHRARGGVDLLAEQGAGLGFEAVAVPLAGTTATRWSSTLVRQLVIDGEMRAAAEVLARPYRLDGVVVHGDHRGRGLGYPTANLAWTGTPTIPADGVYATWLSVGDQRWPSATSVGTNPQFDGQERRVEAYVLDRDDLDLYDADVTLEFVDRIRGQQVFPDVDGLISRMARDVAEARSTLAHDG
jgi:riboflavin kinase/FMN adenylyltransferase